MAPIPTARTCSDASSRPASHREDHLRPRGQKSGKKPNLDHALCLLTPHAIDRFLAHHLGWTRHTKPATLALYPHARGACLSGVRPSPSWDTEEYPAHGSIPSGCIKLSELMAAPVLSTLEAVRSPAQPVERQSGEGDLLV